MRAAFIIGLVLVAVAAGFGTGYAVGSNRQPKRVYVQVQQKPAGCAASDIDCILGR